MYNTSSGSVLRDVHSGWQPVAYKSATVRK